MKFDEAPEGTPEWALRARTGWGELQERFGGLKLDGWPGLKTLGRVLKLEQQLVEQPTSVEPPPGGFSFGGEPQRGGVNRDPSLLLPGFAANLEKLFARLRDQGHEPFLWEGYRSFERAQRLSDKGTGIVNSMHCYGAAADIVDADMTPWTAPSDFWDAIWHEAEDLGMYVLYKKNGRRKDRPHVQAIPVKEQNRFRAMTDAQRRQHVAAA